MSRFRKLSALCALVLPLIFGASLAAEMADGDGDDLKGGEDEAWWLANGKVTVVSGAHLENGTLKYYAIGAMYYRAENALNPAHVKTSTNISLRHRHAVPPLDNTPPYNTLDKANLFYDYFFGAKDDPKKSERIADATLKTNCHAYAFGTLNKGTYDYWVDNLDTVYETALNEECERKDKGSVKSGDLLFYVVEGTHSTVVDSAGDYKTRRLKWKAASSGIYRMYDVGGSFDTPRYQLSGTFKTGDVIDMTKAVWLPAGMGSGDKLWGGAKQSPGTSVWRKK